MASAPGTIGLRGPEGLLTDGPPVDASRSVTAGDILERGHLESQARLFSSVFGAARPPASPAMPLTKDAPQHIPFIHELAGRLLHARLPDLGIAPPLFDREPM